MEVRGFGFFSLFGIVYCSGRILIADLADHLLIELDRKGNYKNAHADEDILRPFALAASENELFITRANTGRDEMNKTIHSYSLRF